MIKKSTLTLFVVALLAFTPAARGAGFLIYEHGAAAQAMAGAFTSIANNPSAIWHNPAGLAWVDGTQLMLGATFIVPVGSVTMPNLGGLKYKQENQVFYPPNVYITHKFSDRVTAGIGFMAPFGLGTKWPNSNNDFPLRYAGVSNDMKTFFINPTIAFKLTDKLSLGVGVSYIFSSLELNQVLPAPVLNPALPMFDIPVAMKTTGTSFNWNAGILYREKTFSLGLSYRSHFNIKYDGDATLSTEFTPDPYKPFIPTSGTVTTTFKFPDIMTVGISFNLTQKLIWSVDFHEYFWKRYDAYTIEFTSAAGQVPLEKEPLWKNSYCLRTGFQYQASERLALRAGAAYDRTPQPLADMDPNLPDANRMFFTVGLGYKIGKLMLDFAYHFETFQTRTSDNGFVLGPSEPNLAAGTYKTQAHLLGINLGYKF
jgi:long-chain fatty acid transport protein